ncbi:MAG TPA: J domain-containing protein [Coleofasciculaceae cyanobacterium]
MLDAERCYRVLDLTPDASPEEIHQGYLDMTWVWHPDRFAGHPRLQQKAHNKLQELNEAHEQLRSFQQASRMKTLRTQAKKAPTSPPPPTPSYNQGLYKPKMHQVWRRDDKPTMPDSSARSQVKTRQIDDWLD